MSSAYKPDEHGVDVTRKPNGYVDLTVTTTGVVFMKFHFIPPVRMPSRVARPGLCLKIVLDAAKVNRLQQCVCIRMCVFWPYIHKYRYICICTYLSAYYICNYVHICVCDCITMHLCIYVSICMFMCKTLSGYAQPAAQNLTFFGASITEHAVTGSSEA